MHGTGKIEQDEMEQVLTSINETASYFGDPVLKRAQIKVSWCRKLCSTSVTRWVVLACLSFPCVAPVVNGYDGRRASNPSRLSLITTRC